ETVDQHDRRPAARVRLLDLLGLAVADGHAQLPSLSWRRILRPAGKPTRARKWSRRHRSRVLDHERSVATGIAGAFDLALRPPLPAGDAGGPSPFDFPGGSGRACRVSPILTPGSHPSGSGGPTLTT